MTKEIAPFTMLAYLSGSWVDITADVRQNDNIKASWGIRGNRPGDRLADAGSLVFTLDNHTGKYSPDGASALSGWGKGVAILLGYTYDSELYYRARGVVENISIRFTKSVNENTVEVTALDWMNYASKYPVVSPSALSDKRADNALNTLIASMPISPQAVDFASGLELFPAVFDSTTIETTAFTEFSKLIKSESGYLYIRKDKPNGGTLTFEAADTRNGLRTIKTVPVASASSGFLLMETGDHLLLETGDDILLDEAQDASITDDITGMDLKYGDAITNRFTVRAYPKKLDTEDTVLYSLSSPMPIATEETITFRAQYTDPTGGARVNASNGTMITPAVKDAADPYLMSLLHFNGADSSTTFTDESGKVWTAYNGAVISTTVSKLGGGVGSFSGTNEYIDTPSDADFDFGAGDFTVEWYAYLMDAASGDCTLARDGTSNYPPWALGFSDGTNLNVYLTSTGTSWNAAYPKTFGKVSLNSWVHYAITRSGNTFRTFRDGQLQDSWMDTITILPGTLPVAIGRVNNTKYQFVYVDELRISKGIARWTANFIPPTVQYTGLLDGDYLANTADDGSGTDLTPSIVISAIYGSEAVIYTIQNTSASDGFITLLQARGRGIYQYNPVELSLTDAASIAAYGYQNDAIEQQYQQNLIAGKREAAKYLDIGKKPRTDLKSFSILANVSTYHMMLAMNLDVGDLVQITDTNTGVDSRYYIQSVNLTRSAGGIISATYGVRQAWSLAKGLTGMLLDMNSTGTTDAVNFGSVPQASNLRYMSVSAWIYVTSAPAATSVIISNFSDFSGWRFSIKNDMKLQLYQKGVSFPGDWRTTGALSLNAWHNVTVTRDTLLATNQPALYIDGAAAAFTEVSAQSGVLRDDASSKYFLGNSRTVAVNYTYPLFGKIKDARVYNRILTAAEVAALNSAGAYDMSNTTGMVFQAPCVRTKELAYWTNRTLTVSDRIIDNVNGVVGAPHGTVITRTV